MSIGGPHEVLPSHDHADGPLADLSWVPAWSCHRSILSKGGASNFSGAVHLRDRPPDGVQLLL